MMLRAFVLVLCLAFISASERELVVESDGYGNIRLGKTKMSRIKWRHPFANHSKTWRHALYRTTEGKIGVMYYYERVELKNGVTYFFNYERGQEDPVTLSEVMFELPLRARLQNGIRLGESTFRHVEEIYGATDISFDRQASKEYENIEFYSDRMIGRDSVNENFVVTAFKLKRW